jgi:hypothetical protein
MIPGVITPEVYGDPFFTVGQGSIRKSENVGIRSPTPSGINTQLSVAYRDAP